MYNDSSTEHGASENLIEPRKNRTELREQSLSLVRAFNQLSKIPSEISLNNGLT